LASVGHCQPEVQGTWRPWLVLSLLPRSVPQHWPWLNSNRSGGSCPRAFALLPELSSLCRLFSVSLPGCSLLSCDTVSHRLDHPQPPLQDARPTTAGTPSFWSLQCPRGWAHSGLREVWLNLWINMTSSCPVFLVSDVCDIPHPSHLGFLSSASTWPRPSFASSAWLTQLPCGVEPALCSARWVTRGNSHSLPSVCHMAWRLSPVSCTRVSTVAPGRGHPGAVPSLACLHGGFCECNAYV
jgi:hypothetical protein